MDLIHENQADLQGKHVTPENFSDRIIFMSMFNDIVQEKRGNEDSCAITSRKIKEHASNSTKDTGHSWDVEKKASGVKDMQPIMVAKGIFVLHRWWKISRIQDTNIPGDESAGPWDIEEENIRDTISMGSVATLTFSTGLFIPRISSVFTEQSQSGVEISLEQILKKKKKQVGADMKVLAKHPERKSNKTGRSQVIGGYSETTASFGKPNAPEFEGFLLDVIYEQN